MMKNYWFLFLAFLISIIHFILIVYTIHLPIFELMAFYILISFGIRYFFIFLWFGLFLDLGFRHSFPIIVLLSFFSFIPYLSLNFIPRSNYWGKLLMSLFMVITVNSCNILFGWLMIREWFFIEKWPWVLITNFLLILVYPLLIKGMDFIGAKLDCPIFVDAQRGDE